MAKVRVYELAKELGVESKTVLSMLKDMGEFVRSASSTVEAPVERRLKEKLASEPPPAKKTAKRLRPPTSEVPTAPVTAAPVAPAPERRRLRRRPCADSGGPVAPPRPNPCNRPNRRVRRPASRGAARSRPAAAAAARAGETPGNGQAQADLGRVGSTGGLPWWSWGPPPGTPRPAQPVLPSQGMGRRVRRGP